MQFMHAGLLLGEEALVRSLTLAGAPGLPDGTYSFIDAYCTDPDCDCRRTMIQVHHDGRGMVSIIGYGWETLSFYQRWAGRPLDAEMRAEIQGPAIEPNSPDLVPPEAMLAFFKSILDGSYREHLRRQYRRFKAALRDDGAEEIIEQATEGSAAMHALLEEPCPCGSGRSLRGCCASR